MIHQCSSILIILVLIISGFVTTISQSIFANPAEAASTWTQETDQDFLNGTLVSLKINKTSESTNLIIDNSSSFKFNEKYGGPHNRYYHKMTPIYGTDKILLYGGYYIYDLVWETYFNDTWIYDLSDNTWTKKLQQKPNFQNEYRYEISSVWGTKKVILFCCNRETWEYNLSSNKWVKKTPMNKPSWREGFSMTSIWGTDKIILYGGRSGNTLYKDTWLYDLSNNNWTKIIPQNSPGKKSMHSLAPIWGTDKVILYDGYSRKDIWIFDLSDCNWTNKNTNIAPPSDPYASLANIYGTDMYYSWVIM
jgi:hypothetical protein